MRIILAIFVCFCLNEISAQVDFPPLSGYEKSSYQVGNTKIEIGYERPAARGREILGGLVPYNKVWRTGAGYCTTIAFSSDVEIQNQSVPKGKYSLFSIPKQDTLFKLTKEILEKESDHNKKVQLIGERLFYKLAVISLLLCY